MNSKYICLINWIKINTKREFLQFFKFSNLLWRPAIINLKSSQLREKCISIIFYSSSRKISSKILMKISLLTKFNAISKYWPMIEAGSAEEFVKVREAARRGGVPLRESLGESKLKPEAARFRAQARSRIWGFHGARVVVTSRRDAITRVSI